MCKKEEKYFSQLDIAFHGIRPECLGRSSALPPLHQGFVLQPPLFSPRQRAEESPNVSTYSVLTLRYTFASTAYLQGKLKCPVPLPIPSKFLESGSLGFSSPLLQSLWQSQFLCDNLFSRRCFGTKDDAAISANENLPWILVKLCNGFQKLPTVSEAHQNTTIQARGSIKSKIAVMWDRRNEVVITSWWW